MRLTLLRQRPTVGCMALRARALLLVILVLPGCAAVAARTPDERGIVATGTGRVRAHPDTATVALGTEVRAASLADATAHVDRTMRDVLARLKGLGVRDADVQTASYRLDPIADAPTPSAPGARIVGYRVANIVHVTTRDVAGLGRLVDAAVAAGATVVRDLNFAVDDARPAQAQARALAVQNAHEQARQLAAAAGVRLGRPVAISEAPSARPVARMTLATGPGPVEPGELDIAVTVEVRFAIEP